MSFTGRPIAKRLDLSGACMDPALPKFLCLPTRGWVVILILASVAMTTAQGQEIDASRGELSPLLKLGFAEPDENSGGNAKSVDDQRSTDELLELDEKDAGSDDAQDERDDASKRATSKQQAIDAALSRLRKPLRQIRIAASEQEPSSPVNQAAAMGNQSSAELISDSGSSIQRYRRRTVCFSHRPLYFQQPNMERCGNGYGCATSAISGVHFLGSALTFPYHAAKQHPGCPVHANGNCRCGQSFPVDLDPRPIDLKAAATQLATMAGISFLLL